MQHFTASDITVIPLKTQLVAIGSSAGGLEALQKLVAMLKPEWPLSYIVAQHLSPTHTSMLKELLGRLTSLVVNELIDGQIPEAGSIYIVPPNTDTMLVKGALRLFPPENAIGPKPSVDRLFFSLARELGSRAIGIILSGTGGDGAKGLYDIKKHGGIAIVQDPASSKFTGMPNAALHDTQVDYIVTPEEIGAVLEAQLSGKSYELPPDQDNLDELRIVIQMTYEQTGVDLSGYKLSTVTRRLKRRMQVNNRPTIADYVQLLAQERAEAVKLTQEVLISVTEFFRDQAAFNALEQVLYELVLTIEPNREVRFWNPGCATGEETYSLAISMEQALRRANRALRYKIFATDIDAHAIGIARLGSYHQNACSNLDPDLCKRYFDQDGDYWTVAKYLRNNIVFSVHNLIQDPPFSRIDVISCRNLLIYFNNKLQKRILSLFNYSLYPNGILFLGRSESIELHKDLFTYLDREARLFRKQANLARNASAVLLRDTESSKPLTNTAQILYKKPALSLEMQVQHFVAEQFGPPGLIINRQDEVLYIIGNVDAYIKIRTGPVAHNVFGLLRDDLRAEARALIHKFRREKKSCIGALHKLKLPEVREIRLQVQQLPPDKTPEASHELLVLFFLPIPGSAKNRQTIYKKQSTDFDTQERIGELERDLASTQEYLQNVIEELETSNEELQSLTEEMQSANEELQSTNEELQTSNEELQSTNEELLTVNDEMEVKSRELEITLADLQNILNSTEHPLLVVDKNFHITRYVPAVEQLIERDSIRQGDIVTAVSWKIELPDLRAILRKVIETGQTHQDMIVCDERYYRFLVRPYQHTNRQIHGAVLWFPEVTDLVMAHKHAAVSQNYLQALFDSVLVGIINVNAQGIIQQINVTAEQMFGYSSGQLPGQSLAVLIPEAQAQRHQKHIENYLQGGERRILGSIRELEARRKDGTLFPIEIAVSEFFSEEQRTFCGVIKDISQRKAIEAQLFDEQLRAVVTLESINDAVITVDTRQRIQYMNPIAEQLTGHTLATALGNLLHTVYQIFDERDHYNLKEDLQEELSNADVVHLNSVILKHANGTEFSIEYSIAPLINKSGRALGAVLSFRDITNKRSLLQQMTWQAQHDPLTGLVNRKEFERRAEHALISASSFDRQHALLYIDLDQFKIVNDTCGHHAGDELLRQLASLLAANLRHRDTLARMGGDEFAILLENSTLAQAENIAVKINDLVQEFRFSYEDKVFKVGASIGVALINRETHTLANLLSDADSACYAAKEAGRNRVQIHSPDNIDLQFRRREMHWVGRINHAIDENRFQLYFQKIQALKDNKPCHWEVLLRLIDESGEIVPPGAFLPAAERYGLMLNIDQWVLKRLVTELGKLPNVPEVSVNLSGISLADKRFLHYAADLFKLHETLAHKICFEITETAAITNFKAAREFIQTMKRLGCLFALDDFGSGMSSFGYLKNLPVDYLKIDGIFVKDILHDQIDLFMVESINRIGQLMNMKTIAEFAENDAIVDKLSQIGVDYAQGFGIGRSIPLANFLSELGLS